ncbi:hypothetical protein [Paraburkholderia acidisoli]|uniref:Uncharacterized protein n=1 Tax=Paraburkholderia acidisoli TaxID=2571748 RepID=A0A7Z2GSB8_9BURK|nr:hypothetical protein [Paraburkholderia acidisoli]QGZ67052.1 hypothetical protein FAZ98_35070 [Paraburkholderia acidisoli]
MMKLPAVCAIEFSVGRQVRAENRRKLHTDVFHFVMSSWVPSFGASVREHSARAPVADEALAPLSHPGILSTRA